MYNLLALGSKGKDDKRLDQHTDQDVTTGMFGMQVSGLYVISVGFQVFKMTDNTSAKYWLFLSLYICTYTRIQIGTPSPLKLTLGCVLQTLKPTFWGKNYF